MEFLKILWENPFLWTILWNIVIAVGIIGVIFVVRGVVKKFEKYLDFITALTVWLLLWIIFLGFFPELIESETSAMHIGGMILFGLFFFYILELFFHWHHCKDFWADHNIHKHEHHSSKLIFIGTLIHNMFHWIVLFAAFAIDVYFGIATTLAILMHSIPQNIVNYVMNHNNLKIVLFAAIGGIFGWILVYPFGDFLLTYKWFVLAFITGWLLYTALADIFPNFKQKWILKIKIAYLIFIVLWVGLFLALEELSHRHWEEEENHYSIIKNNLW